MADKPEEGMPGPQWDWLWVWLATGLGAGRSPIMPGTVGSAWGLPLTWFLVVYVPQPGWRGLILIALAAVGVPLCQRAAQKLGQKDPGAVVWDEIVSIPWVFCWLAPEQIVRWRVLLLGFVLHRIFDISKLWPLSRLEKLPGGWGIMLDDLAAALYASGVLYVLARYWL